MADDATPNLPPVDAAVAVRAGAEPVPAPAPAPKRAAADGAAPAGQPMPFLAHLGELRRRLIICLLTVIVAWGIAFAFSAELFEYARMPLHTLPYSSGAAWG